MIEDDPDAAPFSITLLMNSVPTVDGGADVVIPARTRPFELSATGDDADASDSLTYAWEQLDLGPAMGLPLTDNGQSPLFRSFTPTASPNRTFPQLNDLLSGVDTAAQGEVLPTTTRDLNFRVTVRDGNGGVNSDDVLVSVIDTGSPFQVTSPNSADPWNARSFQTVLWDVAGTDGNGINASTVDVLLSIDGGATYTSLASGVANDGEHSIVVPDVTTDAARIRVQASGGAFFDVSDVDFPIDSAPPRLTLSIDAAAVSENGGSTTATVSRSESLGELTVSLVSSDEGEATVVSTIVLADGQSTSAPFAINAVDDDLLDGTQTVTITASAGGFEDGVDTLDVSDHETLSVSIVEDSMSEFGGAATGTVTRPSGIGALTVNLTSNDISEATVDGTVSFADGETVSNVFAIQAVDDALLDGLQTVEITAASAGYVSGADSLEVTDHEALIVTISSNWVSETGSAKTARVRRTDPDGELTVTLASSDVGEATVPMTVVIADGQLSSAAFEVTPVDDGVQDDPQLVTITASASSYVDGDDEILVTDHTWHYAPNPVDVNAENGAGLLDAFLVIDQIRSRGLGTLPTPDGANSPPYIDVNNDGDLGLVDAFMVIDAVRGGIAGGEGEASAIWRRDAAGRTGADAADSASPDDSLDLYLFARSVLSADGAGGGDALAARGESGDALNVDDLWTLLAEDIVRAEAESPR